MDILKNTLKEHGLKEKAIVSDNNCQFHAVIDQCLQNGIVGWNYKMLRRCSVQWLRKNAKLNIDGNPLYELFDLR